MKGYSKNFWLLCLSGLLFFASFSIMLPDLPAHLEEMGGGEHIGLIVFLFTVSALISRPFSGRLADQWGRIPVMVMGALVSAVAAILYPFASTIFLFLVLRMFHGFSTGFKPTGTAAYVADIVPATKRGIAMGIVGFASNTGTAISMSLGPWITLNYGINALFVTSAVLGILSIVVLAGMKETLKDRSGLHYRSFLITREDYYEPRVLLPATILFLTLFTFGAVLTLGPGISDSLNIENKGRYFSIYVLASLAVRIFAGRLSDIYGRVYVLRFAIPLLVVAAVLMGTAHTPIQLYISSVALGISLGITSPTIYAWTIDRSLESHRGRGIATMYIFLEAGIGMGALMSGYVFSLNGNRQLLPFLICAFFCVCAFIILMSGKREKLEKGEFSTEK